MSIESRLTSRDDWAIITATREAAGPWDCEENVRDNAELLEILDDAFEVVPLTGAYNGVDQGPSFLVFGITAYEACELGDRFWQESVLTPKGLVKCDDFSTMAHANGANSFGIEATREDFFLTVTATGESFSIGLNFEGENE